MSYLVHCTFTLDDGRVLHEETSVFGEATLASVAKGINLPGIGHGVFRLEFDPPLLADPRDGAEEAA